MKKFSIFFLTKLKVVQLVVVLLGVTLLYGVYSYKNVFAETSLNINEFQIPTEASYTSEVATDTEGNVWFTEESLNKIGKLSKDGNIIEFELTYRSQPHDIAVDSNNNIWFTEIAANSIGKISGNGTISSFVLPNPGSYPHKITLGADNNIWFTEYWGNRIGKIDSNGEITEYTIPSKDSFPHGITSGADNNIWFTESNTKKIGRISIHGEITEFPINTTFGQIPTAITSGPDGNLWFIKPNVSSNNHGIGRITLNGVSSEFFGLTSSPYDITSGPEGKVWFTERIGDKLGSIDSNGHIMEFTVPDPDNRGITAGVHHNDLWYAETSKNSIAHVITSQVTPQLPTPTPPNTGGTLNVPYFSQNVDPWGSSEYDHTKLLGATGLEITMNRWGCAVTSVAMVLRYHNITQLPDGTSIDPGSLNVWLKNNDGYAYGYDKNKNWFSSIKWNEISKLTQQLYRIGKAPYKLEFNPPNDRTGQRSLLNEDLTIGNQLAKIPNILHVNNSHFVVAKGINGNTYALNDPEWNYPTLTSFNNTYSQVKRYVPSQTNSSYITAVVNPDVEILVTDFEGKKTGKIVQNGSIQIFNEIPGASYDFQPPITNPNGNNILEPLGTGSNEFMLPKPEDGEYMITLSSRENGIYTLNADAYEADGTDTSFKNFGSLNENIPNTFSISFSQTETPTIDKQVTFKVLKSDISSLYQQEEIKNKLVYNTLKFQIELAERTTQINRQPLGNKLASIPLRTFILELNKVRGKYVTEDAYQVLYKDVTALIKSLQDGLAPEPTPTPGNGGS